MRSYKLSNEAKEDLIRIHHNGVLNFGTKQADKYFNSFFDYFKKIAENPYSFESVDQIREGYRRCVCGVDTIYFKLNENIQQVEIMAIIGRKNVENKLRIK